MTVRILAALALLILAPEAAFAAVAVQQTPAPPPVRSPLPRQPSAFERQMGLEGDVWRNSLTQQATVITSPARMSRAERLAELVNEGKCEEARQIAIDEGDRRLARRITQLCSLDD